MFRQSLKEPNLSWPANRQAHVGRGCRSDGHAAELNQPDHRRGHHRKQSHRQPILVPQDAPALDATNAMLDHDPLCRDDLVLRFLLLCQLTSLGLLVRRPDLRVIPTGLGFVTLPGLVGDLGRQRHFFIELDVRLCPTVSGTQAQDFSVLIRGDLRLEGMPFLLARIEPSLPLRLAGPPSPASQSCR
jgi:hypothetical protein